MVHKNLLDRGHFTISRTAVNRPKWQEACRELVVYARHFTASMQHIPEDRPSHGDGDRREQDVKRDVRAELNARQY